MAITELIERIEGDAGAEADSILAKAQAEARQITGHAEAAAASERAGMLAAAARAADDERDTMLANARLAARDSLLARKREIAERVLDRARVSLEELPDAEYCDLMAAAIADVATGTSEIAVAPADARRLSGLGERLERLGVHVTMSAQTAPLDRGVVLSGDRVRSEISPASMVSDRRDQLLLVAARALFGGTE